MLVLSRQRDETIMIGDEIEITVVDIRGDKVRLGISAPTRITVHRKEVYEAIKAENERAARLAQCDVEPLDRPPSNGAAGRERTDLTRLSGAVTPRCGSAQRQRGLLVQRGTRPLRSR